MYISDIKSIEDMKSSLKEKSNKFYDIEKPSISDGKDALEFSEKMINTFFLLFGDQIKDIYGKIEMKSLPYNKVESYGISEGFKKYEEYNQGMHKFIYNMFDKEINDSDDDDYIKDRVKKAYKLDKVFLENIYKEKNKVLLNDAISDIETIIDISKFISYEKAKLNDIESHVNNKIGSKLTSLYVSSIVNFVFKSLYSIFKTYEEMTKSIQRREPIKEVEKQKYVLV